MNEKVVAIVESRMNSSRLPGKVLMEAYEGKSFLELIIERLKRTSDIDQIVVATTDSVLDDPIEALCTELKVEVFRGSEDDVLSRVLLAARKHHAKVIVELHGDCPFLDPDIISQAIALYRNNPCDYVKNFEPNTYPDGLDVQVFGIDLLEKANIEGQTREDREHVSWYFRKRPDQFRHLTLSAPQSLTAPELGLTLDTQEDLDRLRPLLKSLSKTNFTALDVINQCQV